MCNFRSYILTRNSVLSLPMCDSHERIIEHYGLNDRTLCPDFVRVEVSPEGPSLKLVCRMDQDYTPDWYCPAVDNERAVAELQRELDQPDSVYAMCLTGKHAPSTLDDDVRRYVATSYRVPLNYLVTAEMEPYNTIRYQYASSAMLNRLVTAQEEPCADCRRQYMHNCQSENLRVLTPEEEPDPHNRKVLFLKLMRRGCIMSFECFPEYRPQLIAWSELFHARRMPANPYKSIYRHMSHKARALLKDMRFDAFAYQTPNKGRVLNVLSSMSTEELSAFVYELISSTISMSHYLDLIEDCVVKCDETVAFYQVLESVGTEFVKELHKLNPELSYRG